MYSQAKPSLVMSGLVIVQVLGTVACFVSTRDYVMLLLLITPFIISRLRERLFLASVGYSIALTLMCDQDTLALAIIFSTSSVILGTIAQYLVSESPRFTDNITVPLLLLIPIYIVNPLTLIYPLTSLVIVLLLAVKAYIALSKAEIQVSKTRFTVNVGEVVNVPVRVACPGKFSYLVQVDGSVYSRGESRNLVELLVKVPTSTIGVQRRVLSILIKDLRNMAQVESPPITIEITAIPRLAEVMKRSENLIRRYAAYIGVPTILKGFIDVSSAGSGLGSFGTGLYGHSPGNALGVSLEHQEGSTQSASGNYYSQEDVGISTGYGQTPTDSSARAHAIPMSSTTMRSPQKNISDSKTKVMWHRPLKILDRLVEKTKSYVGEYIGIREFQPGDTPRAIHWKKSLRAMERDDLVVKLYSAETLEKGAGGRDLVIIADLVTPSPRELDMILYAVYSTLLKSLETPIERGPRACVYLILPRGVVYFIDGKILEVISALNTILVEEGIRALYDYDPLPRGRVMVVALTGFARALQDYYVALGTSLAKDLGERGIAKHTVVHLLFSRAFIYKYSIIATILEKAGYQVSIPEAT